MFLREVQWSPLCVLRFDGGHFTSSLRKRRAFKEIAAALRILCGGVEIWSSASHRAVERRFDVEILADTTAEVFYRHARILAGERYFLPNQGDLRRTLRASGRSRVPRIRAADTPPCRPLS